ncbi:sugar kinase [Saccharopolyspora hirsuta]|uniref:Sugar kinase n=1 Tax=Saccharopolyspora hirsuta TaxID=1837 RepID=A0A5M7BRL3_SACHI|nr:sugar kinase [Saccharopolyspora hirsuta]
MLCLGETMSLVSPASPVPLEQAPVFTLSAGGAESNVAIHLAALGHRVGWASRVGDDPLGRRLVATIAAAGVDTGLVEVRSDAPTGVYFKDPTPQGTRVHYYRAGSAASTMDEDFLPDDVLDAPQVLHLSGITPALSAGCDRLVRHLLTRPRRARITFDVNYRPALWPVAQAAPELRELAQLADTVFVGLDEATALWGVETPEDVRKLLDRPSVVVVKDGADAAHALGAEAVTVPAPEVEVVEPVGAGDAFAAGFISGVLRGADAVRCLRLGHLLAAHSLLSTEDHTASPDRADLARWLDLDEGRWRALSFGAG